MSAVQLDTAPVKAQTHPTGGREAPEQLLRRFGLEHFRPGQREAVDAALSGRDCLVVMPTGGGKSLCYQLPALAGEDLVVVVSPLIALMADQLQRLQRAGLQATMLASTMADGHNSQALAEIREGHTRLVLVAPERFGSLSFRSALARRNVPLFVVDEAHCVAEWGHDFRPDYLRLHDVIGGLSSGRGDGRPAVMAATATATPQVADEIADRLGLRDWLSIRSGFDRPNLAFDVLSFDGKGTMERKWAALVHALSGDDALPAIVYCGSRRDCESVAARLSRHGHAAVAYHAGMSAEARTASQSAFMDGEAQVIVATNAFGMGVDKSNVRTVAHWALPTSLEAYYQEAGRGGRDGLPARALLLASRMDLGRLVRFIKERETSVDDVKRFVARMRDLADEHGVAALSESLDERSRILLSIAERAGALELSPGGARGLLVRPTGQGSVAKATAAIRSARERSWRSYRSIEQYGIGEQMCRRRQILDHFGDEEPCAPTGRCCDVCEPDRQLQAASRNVADGRGSAREGRSARRAGQHSDRAMAIRAAEVERPEDFLALRAWRMRRAQGRPAFTVASDAVLAAVISRRPGSLEELMEIRGVGPSFCERHGEALIDELARLAG